MAKANSTPTKTPAKRSRKPRTANVEFITPSMRKDKVRKEFFKFYDTATEVEQMLVGHLKPFGPDAENLMKDARRLIGESLARCKVIPFPLERVRKSDGSAAGRKPKIGSAVIDLQRGV